MKTQQNQPARETTSSAPPGLGRRLGAIFYDLLLVAALLIVAAIPFVLLTGDTSKNIWTRSALQAYLLFVMFLYYGWCWTHGGQTLGLKTWKLRVVAQNGAPIGWPQALRRFSAAALSLACLGIGFLWVLFNRDKLAWHDQLSATRLVREN